MDPMNLDAGTTETSDSTIPSDVSYPDGDVILKSSDGTNFCVDSVVLSRASPVLRHMFAQCSKQDGEKPIIAMAESADVLVFILRGIYPVATAPEIISDKHGQAVMTAFEKFDITSHAIHNAFKAHLASLEPLRAWALAVRFGWSEDVKAAGKRFMVAKDEVIRDWEELKHVGGYELAKLISLRRSTFFTGGFHVRNLLSSWICYSHWGSSWYKEHLSLMERTMFETVNHSEDGEMEKVIRANGACQGCLQLLGDRKSQVTRKRHRASVTQVLEAALAEI